LFIKQAKIEIIFRRSKLKLNDMTVKIDKSNVKNISKILGKKLDKSNKPGNLAKHFGLLKRNIDGLEYQQSIRENED